MQNNRRFEQDNRGNQKHNRHSNNLNKHFPNFPFKNPRKFDVGKLNP